MSAVKQTADPERAIAAGEDEDDRDFGGMWPALKSVLTSVIGRILLAVFTILVVPLLPGLIELVNNVFGYGWTDYQVKEYAEKAILGAAGLFVTWLLNNGLFERGVMAAKGRLDEVKNSGVGSLLPPTDFDPKQIEDVVDRHMDRLESRYGQAGGATAQSSPNVPGGRPLGMADEPAPIRDQPQA